ncbi:hypothetical protein HK096_005091, partial [Nowakowskiella sp. JEL0078]
MRVVAPGRALFTGAISSSSNNKLVSTPHDSPQSSPSFYSESSFTSTSKPNPLARFYEFRLLKVPPTPSQKRTFLLIGVYFISILILWNLLRGSIDILYPFKLVTVAFHELGHAIACWLSGGKVLAIDIDPNQGGKTTISGGSPVFTLCAGYLGSSLIGSLLVMCGFSFRASKFAAAGLCVLLFVALVFAAT